jgi:hypothetical protein
MADHGRPARLCNLLRTDDLPLVTSAARRPHWISVSPNRRSQSR